MKGWILDAYRANGKVVLWVKTSKGDERVEMPFSTSIYVEPYGEKLLKRNKIPYTEIKKKNYHGQQCKVLEVPVNIMQYESLVRQIEKKGKHRLTLYNADVPPEQQFFYKHDLYPGISVEFENSIKKSDYSEISLTKCAIFVGSKNKVVNRITLNEDHFEGEEINILKIFLEKFNRINPDIIMMESAFAQLPFLAARLEKYGLEVPFHRWDATPIKYRGGKTFFSYGQVSYKDFAIRLKGRFLIDTLSTVASECDVEGILELCKLTGARFQQVASRSFGASFQHSLVRLMCQNDLLIPYKEKPVDIPLSIYDMLKGDRGGQYLDAKVGFHKDVAEIDFSSMFPHIIVNKNISVETIQSNKSPLKKVPGLPIRISHAQPGLVPQAVKPILERRMYYKDNPSVINNSRSVALKWVLVTAYGYLRFREFKLGVASAHMAICAYAREILLQAVKLAEENGFEVIHGIVDSLYVRKRNIQREEVQRLAEEIGQLTGIPVCVEGIFKWIVFLPSVNDSSRPLPATYYGTFSHGDIKARGIEVRQGRSPRIIKKFQQKVLELMSECNSKQEIVSLLPEFCQLLRTTLIHINEVPAEWLAHKVRISTDNYKHNLPQTKIVAKMKRNGLKVVPGMHVRYVMQRNYRPVLISDYSGKPDMSYYRKLLVRSLFIILQPFKIRRNKIAELSGFEKQLKITDFTADKYIRYVFWPYYREYKSNFGLSERQTRKKLESEGWEVWRGGLLNILKKDEIYPNVRRKYSRLLTLLHHHHPDQLELLQYWCTQSGMPDFICFRNGSFKFVECKFNHEPLSRRQKRCIQKLQSAGFPVEVIKFVEAKNLIRVKEENYHTGQKQIISQQLTLKCAVAGQ